MKLQSLLVSLGLLHSAFSFENLQSPECVSKCWDNSKYVSACIEPIGIQCLCEDTEFQNVLLQCLYSQCQTTQFGSALHHALSYCSDPETYTLEILPPLIRHQGLRKRGSQATASVLAPANTRLISASAKVAIHSVARRSIAASAFARYSARPTRSIGHIPAPTPTLTALVYSTLLTSPMDEYANGDDVLVPTMTV